MYLTTAQVKILRDFYKIACRGSDVFEFPDPEAQAPTMIQPSPMLFCRWTGAPTISATSAAGMWAASLPMEIIP
jgi:hypothetical protein